MAMVLKVVPKEGIRGHNLDTLWSRTRLALKKYWKGASPKPLDDAESIILAMHKADPGGDGFRYWRTMDGKGTLADLPGNIDLRGLKTAMQTVHNFLDGCSSTFDADFDALTSNQ
jgi:hypothetical protein